MRPEPGSSGTCPLPGPGGGRGTCPAGPKDPGLRVGEPRFHADESEAVPEARLPLGPGAPRTGGGGVGAGHGPEEGASPGAAEGRGAGGAAQTGAEGSPGGACRAAGRPPGHLPGEGRGPRASEEDTAGAVRPPASDPERPASWAGSRLRPPGSPTRPGPGGRRAEGRGGAAPGPQVQPRGTRLRRAGPSSPPGGRPRGKACGRHQPGPHVPPARCVASGSE